MNMISVQSFVIEHAIDFITILEEDFPRQYYCFHELFPAFSMTSLIRYLNFSCHVYIIFVSFFFFLDLDSLCEIVSFS